MSLINEALKRAEEDKLRSDAGSGPALLLPPAQNSPSRRRPTRKWMLLLGAAVLAAAGGWYYLGGMGSGTPARVAAKPVDVAPQAVRVSETDAAAPLAASPKVAPSTTPSKSKPAATSRPVEVAITRTAPAKPASTQPAAAGAGRSSFRPFEAIGNFFAAAKTPTPPASQPAALADKSPGTSKPTGLPPQKTPAATGKAPQAAKAQATAAKPAADASRFTLSGVMQTDDGGTAIINGCVVRLGQTVNGAKLVRIDQYTVELEMDGARIVVRM